MLFRDGQASCEILQTMDQALQNPEILSLGAQVLGLAAGSHSKFRAEIATGDGVSLFVEAMKSHSKDLPTLTALFVAMVNICYNNKDNKNAFISSEGMDVFQPAFALYAEQMETIHAHRGPGEDITAEESPNGSSEAGDEANSSGRLNAESGSSQASERQLDHFMSVTLALLRNVAPLLPKDRYTEPLVKSLMHFILHSLKDKPSLIGSALTSIVTLLSTSVPSKTLFVSKWKALEDVLKLFKQYASHPRVMQPLTVILQLLVKINANRTAITNAGFLPLLHTQFSKTHTHEPGVLQPTVNVFYQLTFNTKTRSQVAALPELMKQLLASLQINAPAPRLHACTSKLLIRLCSIDSCKRQVQAEGGITAILTPMNMYSGDTRVTKFLAQLVNIVLTTNSNSSSSNANQRAGESDSYSDTDSDTDSDSSSSSSSEGTSSSSSSSGPPSPRVIPVMNTMDLDAAIAELEASTKAPVKPTKDIKKPSPKKTTSTEPGRPGTPITDSSIDDLNALAQQVLDDVSAGKQVAATSSTASNEAANARLQEELNALRARFAASEEEITKLKTENNQLKLKESTEGVDQSAKLQADLEALLQSQSKLEIKAAEMEKEAQAAKEGERNAQSELERLRKDIQVENAVMEAQLASLSASMAALQAQGTAASEEVVETNRRLESANTELKSQLETAQETLKNNQTTASEKLAEAEEKRKSLESENARLLAETTSLRTAASTESQTSNAQAVEEAVALATAKAKEQAAAEAEEKHAEVKAQLEAEAAAATSDLLKQLEALKSQLSSRDGHYKSLESELAELRRENETIRAEKQKLLSNGHTDESTPLAPSENTKGASANESAAAITNQVFSQPVPSFLAPSVSSSSSATGGRADAVTSPLSDSSTTGHDDLKSTNHAMDGTVNGFSTSDSDSNAHIASSSNGSASNDEIHMKEKGWIRLDTHQSTVANFEKQIQKLTYDLEDALAHSMHFQVLSIRLDYHSRGESVPSIEAIREFLSNGSSPEITFGGPNRSTKGKSKSSKTSSMDLETDSSAGSYAAASSSSTHSKSDSKSKSTSGSSTASSSATGSKSSSTSKSKAK
jgi:hypothetical protein